jgi:hypothetical protein
MRWLGHVFRTEESYLCRKSTFSKPAGVRKVGRPKVRLPDIVESDLQISRIRWKEKSLDRIQRNDIITAPKAE